MGYFDTMRKMVALTFAFLSVFAARADQVEMKNGDRYNGHVLSLTADSVVLENEIWGRSPCPAPRSRR